MILAKVDSTLFTQIAGFLLGGGLTGGIVSYRKGKSESDGIVVQSAKVVLEMSTSQLEQAVARHGAEMEEMRDAMREMKAQNRQAREQQAREATVALAECQAERRELRLERDAARAINGELRQRIEALEAINGELRQQIEALTAEVARLASANGKA